MNNVTYQAAVLRAGKKGILTPDAAGYYTQCIGGLDIENSAGITYSAEKARRLFESTSDFQRRVSNQSLRGELGHPEQTPEYQGPANEDKWLNRLNDVLIKNISVYWAEIGLDENYGRNNPHLNRPNMVGIMARYRPGGAHGHVLEKDLSDPSANVAFSIRAFSIPRMHMGKPYYDLQTIVTFDQVVEPGIFPATKMLSSTLESLSDLTFTRGQIDRAIESATPKSNAADKVLVTTESANCMMELAQRLNISKDLASKSSLILNW